MTPQDPVDRDLLPSLKLPAKFKDFRVSKKGRPYQRNAILDLVMSDKRYSYLDAKTGSGKTLMYVAFARSLQLQNHEHRTLIIVPTKALQTQLMEEFSTMGSIGSVQQVHDMYNILGRDNYTPKCVAGHCQSMPFCFSDTKYCLNRHHKQQAKMSSIVVCNRSLWASIQRYSNPAGLGRFDLIVLDEAHSLPDWLTSFCRVRFISSNLYRTLNITLPDEDNEDDWYAWASSALDLAEEKLSTEDNPIVRYRLERIRSDLVHVMNTPKERWIVRYWSKSALEIEPIWPGNYLQQYVTIDVPKVVLVSGTYLDSDVKLLGIEKSQTDRIKVKTTKHADRRPLIHVRTCKVSVGMSDAVFGKLVNTLDIAIKLREKRNGIIHCQSYKWRDRFLAKTAHLDKILIHGRDDIEQTIEDFKRPPRGKVLLSPAISTGYDFPDDTCRYQVFIRVPFIFHKDPLVVAREERIQNYALKETLRGFLQAYGRPYRNDSDWCESLIFDDNVEWFLGMMEKHLSKWFKSAFTYTSLIPEQMEVPQ